MVNLMLSMLYHNKNTHKVKMHISFKKVYIKPIEHLLLDVWSVCVGVCVGWGVQ